LFLSIDSVVKKKYESIRIGGKFDNLLKNLELLKSIYESNAIEPRFSVNVLLMKRNLEELALFPRFCKEYKIRKIKLDYLIPNIIPEEDPFADRNIGFMKRVENIVKEVRKQSLQLGLQFECAFDLLLNFGNKINQDKGGKGVQTRIYGPKQLSCVFPWTSLYIESDGLALPHCGCPVTLGNIYKDEIDDIWNGKTMQIYRLKLIKGTYEGWCNKRCYD